MMAVQNSGSANSTKTNRAPGLRGSRSVSTNSRAFSLLELLTVIAVIAVILAIVFPALGYVRRSVRVTDTRNLMTNLASAVTVFQTDNRRLPGYFNAREMGSDKNLAAGFSGMQNAMLELAGGVDLASTSPTALLVGPSVSASDKVKVNPALIGSASGKSKAYFVPPSKNFVAQDGSQGGERVSAGDNIKLPELVDSFGTPVLFWASDESTTSPVTTQDDFALESRSTGTTKNAKFYWAQNSAFLAKGAQAVGRVRANQDEMSLLGQSGNGHIASLLGLLGNPSSPSNLSDKITSLKDVLPASARGGFVLHSAGENGIFLAKQTYKPGGGPDAETPGLRGDSAGAKIVFGAKDSAQRLFYGLNFYNPGTPDTRIRDERGGQSSTDILAKFDDVVISGG